MPHDKRQIARAFGQAAAQYDAAAEIQRRIGSLLMERLENRFSDGLNGKTVLDIGAGSGWFSQQLAEKNAAVIALDLAEGMLRHIRSRSPEQPCILADAEALPLADNSIDACFSSLAVQWCDLASSLAEMQRVTRKGGVVAVSTLAEGSLAQLKQAWQSADNTPHVNTFLPVSEIERIAAPFNAEVVPLTLTQHFHTLNDLLGSLKNIGANHVGGRKNGLTGKTRWQRFSQAYAALRDADDRYPLDYRAVLILFCA
ncbi:MAG: malonyl-ACP O-methyltransferase BioC [Neisseria sp.]|nr:malonyl-ACP O-methyltransferase BioC [Neisseria sp.]